MEDLVRMLTLVLLAGCSAETLARQDELDLGPRLDRCEPASYSCTDQDGDYFIAEAHADPAASCGAVCGPEHDELCQGSNDCDDQDPTRLQRCESTAVVPGAYYITSAGAGDHSGASYTDAMSLAEHNGRTFAPGDVIYIAGAIKGELSLVPPSSGSASQPITYRGDHPDHPGSLVQPLLGSGLRQQVFVQNKQHLAFVGLRFESNAGIGSDGNKAALWIEELEQPTGDIEIVDCSFQQTVSGLLIRGDTRHVGVRRSTFRNMTNNGVGLFKYSGRADSAKPSFITIGGSREEGNTFVNIAREDNPTSGSVPGQTVGTQADDLIFSYNHVYADEPGWGAGVYLNGVDRVLVEHNYLHDLDATHRRPSITFKTDFDWIDTDIVIRFNKIGPTHGGGTYVTPDAGIRVGHCLKRTVIYGNYLADVVGFGIMGHWGWALPGTDDGCIVEDLYIFSNIIARTKTASGIYLGGSSSGSDTITSSYITNNLVYRALDEDTTTHAQNYGIYTGVGGDAHYDGQTISNNIIDTPRASAADHIGLRAAAQPDLTADYNHHYFPEATPAVYYQGSDCAPCPWDSPELPAGIGVHDTTGDPLYRGASANDFALQPSSPCAESGEALAIEIPAFNIQGTRLELSLALGLDPHRTNWRPTIPFVHTLDQRQQGEAWEKGPYVYSEAPAPPANPCAADAR